MVSGRPFPHARGAVSHAVSVKWTTGAPALLSAGHRAHAPVAS
jgi:hypothetical protein